MQNQNLTFNEVEILAKYEPEKFIKCFNQENSTSFIMKSEDIIKSVGNLDWTNIKFSMLEPTNIELEKLNYKLCYISNHKAWFTNDFEHQWRR